MKPGSGHLAATLAVCAACLATPAHAATSPNIRVVLSESGSSQQIAGALAWSSASECLGETDGSTAVTLTSGCVGVAIKGRTQTAQRLVATPQRGYARFGGQEYRGHLEFFVGRAGGVVVLNVLPLEDYLAGVVPAEMPPSWPEAALRAQAVAARTYALARMAAQQDDTYDVYATVADQAYRGLAGEDERATTAVRDTAGQILTYDGRPIVAYYCSDAGGYTRAGTQPYLKSVPCESPSSPHREWSIELAASELTALVTRAGGAIGSLQRVTAENDPLSGHLLSLVTGGSSGEYTFTGTELRRLLGYDRMKSTRAWIEPLGAYTDGSLAMDQAPPPTLPVTEAPSFETQTMQGWHRPWVAFGGGEDDLKMRTLFAYNGVDLLRCNREVHLYAGMPESPPATASPSAGAPTLAEVGDGIIIHGSGYGHGLGLSQWGAKQLALDGLDYRSILLHFYSGVELIGWDGRLPPPPAEEPPAQHEFYEPFHPRWPLGGGSP